MGFVERLFSRPPSKDKFAQMLVDGIRRSARQVLSSDLSNNDLDNSPNGRPSRGVVVNSRGKHAHIRSLKSRWISAPGDAHLVYPGVAKLHGAPLEFDKRHSLDRLRYEAMRDGIEDYELLRLPATRSPETAGAISRSVVRSLTDYTLGPTEFNRARRRLLEELSRRP